MKTAFACPGCGASGSVEEALVGRQVRCKQCDHRFKLSGTSEPEVEGYMLVEPTRGDAGIATTSEVGAVFVPSRGGEPPAARAPFKPRRTVSKSKRKGPRGEESEFAWKTWLIRVGIVAAVGLLLIALIAPGGLAIVGAALVMLGSLMVLVGYGAGAYGAFSEDFLFGLLYLVIPLYTGYYIVTRWEDLWRWFACMTAGVGLATLGTLMLDWSGVVG